MALYAIGMLLLFVFITGGVVDYMSLVLQRRDVQNAADAAALASAHELVLASKGDERVQAVARSYVEANYSRPATTSASVIEKGKAVQVEVTSPARTFFAGPIAANVKEIRASAIAQVMGETAHVCVIALEQVEGRALSLDSNAALTAPKCAVYSNSTDKKGLSSLSNAKITGALICTAGGKEGSTSNYSPQPLTDCPPIKDPLAARAPPPVGGCDFNKVKKDNFVGELSPGVYCEGLRIDGNSKVTLKPGIYVINDGEFRVDSNSEITGERVGFFLTGEHARFEFTSNAKIHLSAPKDGPMAGLLFMEDNTIPKETQHRITSDYADYLVGTIYLPRGSFLIDANQDVADESEFTVIVVRTLELKAGPRLVLNTDYGGTDVPVPDGLGNKAQSRVRLTQ